MRIKFISIIFLATFCFQLFGQTSVDSSFRHDELVMSNLAKRLLAVRFNDTLLNRLNSQLQQYVKKTLNTDGAFDYPFDSITPISLVESDDRKVRIFTWNTKNSQGKFNQYGFIQYYIKSKDEVAVYSLIDKSDEMQHPHDLTLTPDNWYGAVYYQIIETKYQGDKLYTLIGWDGNDLFSNKKIIESLVFTSSGRAKFGKNVFKFGREKAKRVIYEYSQMANMMINYDKDLDMIVMDHLSPSKSIYYGNFKMYGPDLSYDALSYDKDYWVYKADIDYKKLPENVGFFKKFRIRYTN